MGILVLRHRTANDIALDGGEYLLTFYTTDSVYRSPLRAQIAKPDRSRDVKVLTNSENKGEVKKASMCESGRVESTR